MKILAALSSILVSGCIQLSANNSTAQDASVFGTLPVSSDGSAASNRFADAQQAIQRNCISCHSGFALHSDQEWIQSGYIAAGDPSASTLYQRIRGSDAPTGGKNMPPTGGMSSEEIGKVKLWIANIATVAVASDAASRTRSALQVIANFCTACHTVSQTAVSGSYSGATVPAFGNYTDDVTFFQNGLVQLGDPANSWIYRSLKSHGNIGTMPKNGAALSTSSADVLYDWILKMGQP